MSTWRILPGERAEMYSPIGLWLRDEFTEDAPLGRVQVQLDIRDLAGVWRATDIRPVITPSGILTYPALGRRGEALNQPPRRYRVRIEAEFYRPLYNALADGVEFDAFPYNDTTPPQNAPNNAQDLLLLPASNYPFDLHIPILRGNVVDAAGDAVANVLVSQGGIERVLTDERGTFSLPLRWVQENVATPIDAVDQRTGRIGSIPIQLPGSLQQSQQIVIN